MFYKLILSPILQTAFPKFLPNHLSPLLPKEQIQVANGEGVLMKKKKKKRKKTLIKQLLFPCFLLQFI